MHLSNIENKTMKIFCIGKNYLNHAKEMGGVAPEKPIVFMKPPTALLQHNNAFYHPDFSDNIHYECEIVVKIAKNGKNIAKRFAHKYIDAIGLGIDFTARDLQAELKAKGQPWEIAKGFNHSAVIGNFVSVENFDDIQNINFHLLKNNKKVQVGNTKDMLFSIEEIIAYISTYFTLQKGDYIYTGTPAGVGKIEINDLLEGFIEDKSYFQCEIK